MKSANAITRSVAANMRVLLITDWNRDHGGAENYMVLLRDGLRSAGDEVRLLTSSAGTAANGEAEHVAFASNRVAAQAFLQIANPFAGALVRRVSAEMRPDIAVVNMFAHHLSPSIFRALGRTPAVLLVSDYKCICPIGSKLLPDESLCQVKAGWNCLRHGCLDPVHWLRDRARYARIDAAVREVDRVIACSEAVKRQLARNDIASEVMLLPASTPSGRFDREPAREPLFLFCGRLDREKGAGLLLRAFARMRAEVPQARLRIAGRGALRPTLEALAGQLGLTNAVEFCGWLKPAQVEEELRRAWALVVPSLWAEPLGLVAIEAITRGVPVIASAEGGLAETVQHEISGLLFPNNDEMALSAHMLAVARSEKFPGHRLPEQIIAQTRDLFDLERHIARMRRLFLELISERARNGAERIDSFPGAAEADPRASELRREPRRAVNESEPAANVVSKSPYDRL